MPRLMIALFLLAPPICAQPNKFPVAVIDTTLGRITCELHPEQAPLPTDTFIRLAEGTKDWTAPNGQIQRHKRFYDGLTFYSVAAGRGINGGDPLGDGKGTAGFTFPANIPVAPTFDAPGRLALVGDAGKFSSRFTITLHSDPTRDGKNPIFGQCDARSIKVAEAIANYLAAAENVPVKPVAINRISIVRPGQPLPRIARAVPSRVPPPPIPVSPPPSGPEPTGPTVLLDTTLGPLTCKLFTQQAPLTTASFLGLVQGTKDWTDPATHQVVSGKPFYDGVPFHRVIPDFMIQGGDHLGNGRGNAGFKLPNETAPDLTFDRPGRLAMANAGPDTGSTQFFVTEHPLHRLDGKYTIFGQCDSTAVKTVIAISRVPRNDADKPDAPIVIRKATVLP